MHRQVPHLHSLLILPVKCCRKPRSPQRICAKRLGSAISYLQVINFSTKVKLVTCSNRMSMTSDPAQLQFIFFL
ncbi:hypothetical protein LINPERPRIM_LOCUS21229 [Linum perenne]